MAYNNDPLIDEDGEALTDPDVQFEEDDDLERNRSPSPIMDDCDEDKVGKPRKRLIKKAGKGATLSLSRSDGDNDLDDFVQMEEEEEEDFGKRGESYGNGKGTSSGSNSFKREKGTKRIREERESDGGKGKGKERDSGGDGEEMKELWDTIAGGSEDDQEDTRTFDDDTFIDDTGVEPPNRNGSDNEVSAGNAPQAEEGEEDDEVSNHFKKGKKKKNNEKSPAELALIVEHFMAELEVIAEEDAELNRQSKPAINKLMKLAMLVEVLSKCAETFATRVLRPWCAYTS